MRDHSNTLTNRIHRAREHFEALKRTPPGDRWRFLLFWTFWLSLASFPIGYGMREVLPSLGVVFLLCYYRHDWQNSVLRRFGAMPLFYCLWGMILTGVVFSGNVWSSFLHAGMGINKGYVLPFIAMECVRDEKDLRRLVWAAVTACFWQGLDGLWQAQTGKDFIMGYAPHMGRLTGSLGDYTVGNYIALALIPAFGLWFILRRGLPPLASAFMWAAALWPAFFLLVGAGSRSGALAVAASLGLWVLLAEGRRCWKYLFWSLPFLLGILALQGRMGLDAVAGDGRWSLWELGWRVFLEHPWFGAGAGQYNEAFRALGLAPEKDLITISHPHNIFLDMLYAHGLVGFTLGMIFLAGFLWWGYAGIRPRLRAERAGGRSVYWRMAGWFWVGYAAWLVNGVFGHDFYRIWWFGLAMSHLGVMVGAVVSGREAVCSGMEAAESGGAVKSVDRDMEG